MKQEAIDLAEEVQKLAVQVIATHPAGEGLCLIGGFRFQLLDRSCRRSLDIDYHWAGDLEAKQAELVRLFRRKLLPLIKMRLGLDGSVHPADGAGDGSATVKTLELAVWRENGAGSRIVIPVDITRVPCADRPVARTLNGIVYLTASNADMAESKVLALFARLFLAERDMLDLFLFQDQIPPDAGARLALKIGTLGLDPIRMTEKYGKILADRDYHAKKLDALLREQVDASASANLRAAGGGAAIFDGVMEILQRLMPFTGRTKA